MMSKLKYLGYFRANLSVVVLYGVKSCIVQLNSIWIERQYTSKMDQSRGTFSQNKAASCNFTATLENMSDEISDSLPSMGKKDNAASQRLLTIQDFNNMYKTHVLDTHRSLRDAFNSKSGKSRPILRRSKRAATASVTCGTLVAKRAKTKTK